MKILVTGGAGFIGSNFIREILSKKRSVQIVNLDKLTYAGNLKNLVDVKKRFSSRYKFIKGDIADSVAVKKAMRGVDIVINYAAETHVDRSIMDPDAFVKTDILGTYNLLEMSRNQKIKKYIQISTDEVYGSLSNGLAKEESCYNPSSPYSASKAGADHLVSAYYKTFGLPTIVTHACNIYGPYQYPEKVIPLFVTNLIEGKKVPLYGAGKNIREWLYCLDHADAIERLMTVGKAGEVYNIGSGYRINNQQLVSKILKIMGFGSNSIKKVKDRPGHDLRYALNSGKMRKLSWRPKYSFPKGLEETIIWYQDNEDWWREIKSGQYLKFYKKQYQS